uniref:Right handed beta helix domain-containing protein n=1 Tax=Amphimedon queenslandica TaxID=400682 RepID=A0A1X7VSA2_AMPQE
MLLFRFFLLLLLTLIGWSYAADEQSSKYYNQIVVVSNCNKSCQSHYSEYEKVTHFYSLRDALTCKPITSHTLILIKKTFNVLTDEVIKLTNLMHIKIEGQGSRNVIVCCNHLSSGLVFDSVFQLRLYNLKFIGCGFLRKEIMLTPVAIMIHNCTNVIIRDVEITKSISLGLLLSNVTGYIEVKDSKFTYNGQGNKAGASLQGIKIYIKGGGMAISSNGSLYRSYYNISSCRFVNNMKLYTGKPSNNYGKAHGGGLLVYITHARRRQALHIHDCIFEGNEAGSGGGAAIKLMYNEYNYIEMNGLIFRQNKATNSTISNGGGLEIYSTTSTSNKSISRSIIVLNCSTFESNTANFGGGLSIDCGSSASIHEFNISNCSWTKNSARSGFAVDVSRHFTIALNLNERVIQPVFANCSFNENHVFSLSQHSFKAGFGAVSVLEVKVEFHSYLHFEGNIGSALSAVMSTVTFRNCNALFLNNNSTFGGAISLNFASLLLSSPTSITFKGNNASEYGGAIYSFITNGHMLYSRELCPFLFSCKNGFHIPERCQDVHVKFINNNATRGSSIYLPSLFPCVLEYSADVSNLIEPDDIFQHDNFYFTGKLSTEVATAVAKQDPYESNMTVYSGEESNLNLTLKDESSNLVPLKSVIFEAIIEEKSNASVTLKNTYINNGAFTIFGPENSNATVVFQTMFKPLLHIIRNIHIDYCPPGFKFLRFTTAKNSALIGISALFVLFFTCAIEISLLILQPAPLYGEGYNILSHRAAFYGELSYFDSKHLRYAIPAIAFLIVLVVPSFMLLLYPLVTSVLSYFDIDASESWIGCILTKGFMYKQMKPFYDRFYGSFRDKHRYFAGMYFVYRLLIQLSYYIPNYTESAFIMETLLVIFLVLHSIIQPYQNKHQNTIDTLLLSNLIIINGITCGDMIILYDNAHNHFWKVNVASNCQAILAVLPMIIALLYIAWKYVFSRIWLKLKNVCNMPCRMNRGEYEILNDDHLEHGRHRSVSLQNHSN